MLMYLLERAAEAQLTAMAATGGRVLAADAALAALTYSQWVGDGSQWDGDLEWPALLRGLDRSDARFPRLTRRTSMPTLRVELFEGRSLEMKRALAKELTDACVRVLGGSADSVDILFYDIAKGDWATGGTLWSERDKPAPQG